MLVICSIAKVFEKIFFNQLSQYLKTNKILLPLQSGFRANHSTTTSLLKLTNDVYSACDTGNLMGAIFIDLKKAFGLVDHYLLLDKLYAIGLSQNALLWFIFYLHNRKQCVVLQGNKSGLFVQQSSVPQGSTFGPLLFSIFITDLPLICANSLVQSYADATVIYTSKPHLLQIQSALQSDFSTFRTGSYLINYLNNPMITRNDSTYLHRIYQIQYLGLWLDSELTFKPHIDHICHKINFGTCALF